MSSRELIFATEGIEPERDRRSGPIVRWSLRWLKSLLSRPLALERRNNQLHIKLAERRRSPKVIQAESLARLREELRARLVNLENQLTSGKMAQIVAVHDALGSAGWPGVHAMDNHLLGKASQQAQLLHDMEPSKRLEKFVKHLRLLQTAAEVREDKALRVRRFAVAAAAAAGSASSSQPSPDAQTSVGPAVEIGEASNEDFDAMQREWLATSPSELDPVQPPSDPSPRRE